MKRYEALAAEIAYSIRTGVLKLGDKLPSIRHASSNRNISTSTVFEAYYLLESQGLIRAKDRSGYFVAAGLKKLSPELELVARVNITSNSIDAVRPGFDVLETSKSRDIVPLGSAFPSPLLFPFSTLGKSMMSSIDKWAPWTSIDDIAQGIASLRRQIALRYFVEGLHVHTDEITVTNGAMEALNLCLMAVTRPGDEVVIESPAFYGTRQALERRNLCAIEVPAHPQDGIDLAALEMALLRHRPKACLLMTNFQNPTGSLMPDEKKRSLVEMLTRYDVPMIENDVYGELYFGSKRPMPAKAFDTKGLVMHCSSFSKSLAPGYCVGWAAPGRFARQVTMMKMTTTLSACVPAQAALADYLAKGRYDFHLRQIRQKLLLQQGAIMRAVSNHFPRGTRYIRPAGGYYLWVELPSYVNTIELQRQALALGISVAPGPVFSAQGHFLNCLRLNYSFAWDDRFESAVATLGQLIASFQNKRITKGSCAS